LTPKTALIVDAPETPLVARLQKDFCRFFTTCMGVALRKQTNAQCHVVFRLRPRSGAGQSSDSDRESFTINISDSGIEVGAGHERGLLQAAHYLERQAALRGGAFYQKGQTHKSPLFHPRISQSLFCLAEEDLSYSLLFTDNYLSLMSHFGVNGIFVYALLWDYCQNTAIPELNTTAYRKNIAQLRRLCQKTAKFGIDVYLHMNTRVFDANHRLFKNHPRARGAPLNYFDEAGVKYSLCSSRTEVLRCYQESFRNLFGAIPELGGAMLIVGGECFLHCFTRPRPPLRGGTSCPHCAGRNPSLAVANMVNGIARAVHSANARARVFVWPYSAFTWSGSDFAQEQLIAHLNKDVSFLSNFETPYPVRFGKSRAALIDYNILNIGPSRQFRLQSSALARRAMPHFAKTESGVDVGFFFLPYIPVHYRWFDRYRQMRRHKAAGFVAKWRLYGLTGSMPEELLAEMTWNRHDRADDLLFAMARRDFGEVSRTILNGWKRLSAAWEKVPASHLLYGERDFYFKGPLYLGPAHPLIFNVQVRYNLGAKFFTVRGDIGELLSKKEIALLEKNTPPRYVSDLLFTYPFGADAVESAMDAAIREWSEGLKIVQKALGRQPNRRAIMELDVGRAILAHLRTTWNVVRFYRVRDAFFGSAGSDAVLCRRMAQMQAILNDEIENARSFLPTAERDFRIGYGHCYGQVYDADMIREKIEQCIFVRDIELPRLKSGIRFHIDGIYKVA